MQTATLNLTLGHADRTLQYRKGTNDEIVIVQALKSSAYNIGQLRRAQELFGFYGRLAQTDNAPLIVDAGASIGASAVYFASSFPKAQVVAIDPDPGNFQLLTANTSDMAVECVQSTVSSGSIDAAYEKKAQASLPFIVKVDLERCEGDVFAENPGWVDRTPVIIVQLNDCLIPGTNSSRRLVEDFADRNRDFVYLHDSIFSISREPILFQSPNPD
jgi:hypothetical protein